MSVGLAHRPADRSVRARQLRRQPARPAGARLGLELVDEVDRVEEAHPRLALAVAPIAIARCVLPEPVPPISTRLRLSARNAPLCSSRTSVAFTGEAAKSNSPSAFITGNLALPRR